MILLDGSYGTEILKKHPQLTPLPDWANLEFPETVFHLHEDYQRAGAELLFTNTFGCRSNRLELTGKSDFQAELLTQGMALAKKAARKGTRIAACLGPQGFPRNEPLPPPDTLKEEIRRCLETLASLGPDLIVFETQYRLDEIKFSLKAATEVLRGSLPVWVSLTVDEAGKPLFQSPDWIREIEDLGASWLGFNCGHGPNSILKAVLEAKQRTVLPLTAKPNLGFSGSAADFEPELKLLKGLGLKALGLCCQSTPEDIDFLKKL